MKGWHLGTSWHLISKVSPRNPFQEKLWKNGARRCQGARPSLLTSICGEKCSACSNVYTPIDHPSFPISPPTTHILSILFKPGSCRRVQKSQFRLAPNASIIETSHSPVPDDVTIPTGDHPHQIKHLFKWLILLKLEPKTCSTTCPQYKRENDQPISQIRQILPLFDFCSLFPFMGKKSIFWGKIWLIWLIFGFGLFTWEILLYAFPFLSFSLSPCLYLSFLFFSMSISLSISISLLP